MHAQCHKTSSEKGKTYEDHVRSPDKRKTYNTWGEGENRACSWSKHAILVSQMQAK